MTDDPGKNKKYPMWMKNLIVQVSNVQFEADDELFTPLHQLFESCCPSAPYDISEPKRNIPPAPFPGLISGLSQEEDFASEMSALVKSKWRSTKRELCVRALLLENTYYKIQSGRRQPSRDTIVCLSLALNLTVEEARNLLGYLGYGLSEHIKRDYIILRCLEMGKQPIEVNLVLEKFRLRPLGPND